MSENYVMVPGDRAYPFEELTRAVCAQMREGTFAGKAYLSPEMFDWMQRHLVGTHHPDFRILHSDKDYKISFGIAGRTLVLAMDEALQHEGMRLVAREESGVGAEPTEWNWNEVARKLNEFAAHCYAGGGFNDRVAADRRTAAMLRLVAADATAAAVAARGSERRRVEIDEPSDLPCGCGSQTDCPLAPHTDVCGRKPAREFKLSGWPDSMVLCEECTQGLREESRAPHWGDRAVATDGATHSLREAPLRPAVLWFARIMEAKLRESDHKGTWEDCDLAYLLRRLTDERRELTRAIGGPDQDREVAREAADVANFAMMIADVCQPVVRSDEWYRPPTHTQGMLIPGSMPPAAEEEEDEIRVFGFYESVGWRMVCYHVGDETWSDPSGRLAAPEWWLAPPAVPRRRP